MTCRVWSLTTATSPRSRTRPADQTSDSTPKHLGTFFLFFITHLFCFVSANNLSYKAKAQHVHVRAIYNVNAVLYTRSIDWFVSSPSCNRQT